MFVKDLSGEGKTSLVYELLEPITKKKSYFTSGKFDETSSNTTRIVPFSGIISALNQWCNLALLKKHIYNIIL